MKNNFIDQKGFLKSLGLNISTTLYSTKILSILSLVLFLNMAVYAQHEHQQIKADSTKPKPKSPRTAAMDMIGENHVHIDYGSPSVRSRQIWNGLVAFGQVWATGAHKATWIEFSQDIEIANTQIPKGKYGFFTIPDKDEWTLILNKVWDMHLADDYDPKQDIIRLKVKPQKNAQMVEALTYTVVPIKKNKGKIEMSWEMLNVSFEFTNK